MSIWLKGLNPEQVQAVMHVSNPLLILAGAGSGKTTVLVARTGRLIDEEAVPAHRICIMTFTNKAARELKERLKAKLGERSKGLWAGTFHSFGLQFLKKHHDLAGLPQGFGVIDSQDAAAIVKELSQNITIVDKKNFDAEKLLSRIQYYREHGRLSTFEDEYNDLAEMLLPKYQDRLKELGVVDFDDLLLLPLQVLQRHEAIRCEIQQHFMHVMVDEFQDTNDVQMKLVSLLADHYKNLAVVGDDDQSIYGWRGAQVSNILGFPDRYKRDHCKTVQLVRNYRSTPEIIRMANQIITNNSSRHEKELKATQGKGETPELFVYENEEDELEKVCEEIERLQKVENKNWSDFAILYRSNSQGALFEAEFRKRKWPYQITGGTAFLDRKEVKDVLAYLRCALRPNQVGLRRILNAPSRGIGLTTLQKVEDYAHENQLSFFKALCRWREYNVQESIGARIDQFLAFLRQLKSELSDEHASTPASQKLIELLQECGYRDHLLKNSKNMEAFNKKLNLIEVFGRVLDSFIARGGRSKKTLVEFVEAMELRDSGEDDEQSTKVQLMSLHASKGLEFPVVFLLGLEEDILPHKKLGSDISEERRLFYVGVTRAKEKLMLSRVQVRKRYGKLQPTVPSRFLLELPKDCYRIYERGIRPVNEEQRKVALEDLYSLLDAQIANEKNPR